MPNGTPVVREAAVIVLAGAALGVLFNNAGLSTRPERGIPWVAKREALPTLESLVPEDSQHTPEADATGPVEAEVTHEAGAPSAGTPPSTGAGPERTPREPSAPAATRPSGAAAAGGGTDGGQAGPSGSPPGASSPSTVAGTQAPPPAPRRSVPLPFIPSTGQPIQVELSTVKRFFDARGALFLDARDPAEFQAGHIPGALRLTNTEAQNEPERVKALPVQGRPIIAYCEGGTCEASLDLARTLIAAGHSKVLVYMGGYPEWAAAGHPVERGSGTP